MKKHFNIKYTIIFSNNFILKDILMNNNMILDHGISHVLTKSTGIFDIHFPH